MMMTPLINALLAAQRSTPNVVLIDDRHDKRGMSDKELREMIRDAAAKAADEFVDTTLDDDWFPSFMKRMLRDERKQRRRVRMRRKRLHGWA